MTQKHGYHLENHKNTVKDSSISAGNNVHIGDIHHHNTPPQKPKQNHVEKIIVVLAVLVVIIIGVNFNNPLRTPVDLLTSPADTASTLPQTDKTTQNPTIPSSVATPAPKKPNPPLEVVLASGMLTDGDTDIPIEGGTISVVGVPGESTTTDKTGTFSLTSKTITQDKEYRLRFERSGYESEVFTYHKTNKIVEVKLFRLKKSN